MESLEIMKSLLEDVLGEFGFRVSWQVRDHVAKFTAFEITARNGETKEPMFNRLGWKSLPDPVESIEEAESYAEGFVKWDGCSEIDFGQKHLCGPGCYKSLRDLLKYIYLRAFELMEREPDEPWEE